MMRFIFSLICLLIAMSVFGQSDVRLHPTQIGLFGAGSGQILVSNPASGGAQWSSGSTFINGLIGRPENEVIVGGGAGSALNSSDALTYNTSTNVFKQNVFNLSTEFRKTITPSFPIQAGKYWDICVIDYISANGVLEMNCDVNGDGYGVSYSTELPISYNMDWYVIAGAANTPPNIFVNVPVTSFTGRHFLTNPADFSFAVKVSGNTMTVRARANRVFEDGFINAINVCVRAKGFLVNNPSIITFSEANTTGIDTTTYQNLLKIYGASHHRNFFPAQTYMPSMLIGGNTTEMLAGTNEKLEVKGGSIRFDGEVKFTSNLRNEAGTFHFDAVAGKLGIGTNAPLSKFSLVNGDIGVYTGSGGALYLGDLNYFSSGFFDKAPGIASVDFESHGIKDALGFYYYSNTPGFYLRTLGGVLNASGNWGFGTTTPARRVHVAGSMRVTTPVGTPSNLWGYNADGDFGTVALGSGFSISSGTLNAAFLPSGTNFGGDVSGTASNLQINSGAVTGFDIANNTVTSTNLSNTGVTSGTYGSSSQTPVITVGTDGRLISASSATTSNLYSADGTIPASTTRTVTLGDGAGMRIDATNWSSSPATPLILKGNASTASYRFLEAVDSDNTMRFRGLISTSLVSLSSTTRAIEISGMTTVGLACGTGQFIVDAGGYMRLNSLTSNPGSPQNGAFWYNSTEGKLKIRQTTTQTVATVENDVIGNSTAIRTGNFTLAEQDFHTILDANTASFTVTLGGTMREGIIYTFECRRNGTNSISFDAASGFVLAFPGWSSFPDDGVVACGGAGTGRQAPHLTYMARRNGANITIF